jgi:pimeloyl-ACP methyl ester carboxylesterase
VHLAFPNQAQEQVMIIRSTGTPDLFVHRWPGAGQPVLYVNGATFPSRLSVGYAFDGRSWADDLQAAGFDVWALDFAGFGCSGRYPEMSAPADAHPPLGRAPVAAAQIAAVVQHIGHPVHIVAHSWGTIAAGRFAAEHSDSVMRLVFFGPIAQRDGARPSVPAGAWREVTVADQLKRFVEDVPAGHAPVLLEPELAAWGPAYLASDPDAGYRAPPSVRIPNGPGADILAAHSGALAYDPGRVCAPVLIVRGIWDHLCRDADAGWLLSKLGSTEKAGAIVPAATHLMHLERGREGLFKATTDWLKKGKS